MTFYTKFPQFHSSCVFMVFFSEENTWKLFKVWGNFNVKVSGLDSFRGNVWRPHNNRKRSGVCLTPPSGRIEISWRHIWKTKLGTRSFPRRTPRLESSRFLAVFKVWAAGGGRFYPTAPFSWRLTLHTETSAPELDRPGRPGTTAGTFLSVPFIVVHRL